MRAWQASLDAPPPIGRTDRMEVGEAHLVSHGGWSPPRSDADGRFRADDDGDDDPEVRIAKRDDIVPRRPGVAGALPSADGFWSNHLFWKGIVVGAVIVLVVKIVIAVQAPYGVDWYDF